MFFFVKYIDYKTFKKAEEAELLRSCRHKNAQPEENKELIVNPDCYIGIILDYIFKAVGVEDDLRRYFDLWTDRAKAVSVALYEPTASGTTIFSERATYYVVYQDPHDVGDEIKPLLHKTSQEYSDFCSYLRKRSFMRRRSAVSKSSSKGSQLSRGVTGKSSKGSFVLSSKSSRKSKSCKSIV